MALGRLNGIAQTIPSPDILLSTLPLQEAKESSEIESIIMTNETADMTVQLVQRIKEAMQQHKEMIKQHSKIYSHELINNLYKYPYTKIEFVAKDCNVHRNTASRYLEQLVNSGVLNKVRIQRDNFYVNEKLFAILSEH